MNKEKPFSSYRWHTPPVVGESKDGKPQTREERIESKKTLLEILVRQKVITQEEADNQLAEFIKNYK